MNPRDSMSRGERINALTAEARSDPEAFRAELRRLMRLGRLYVQGVLILLMLLVGISLWSIPAGGGLAAVFLLWIAGGMAFFVFRSMSLWSKPPSGVAVKRSEVPKLFEQVDQARRESGLRDIHRIHLTEDFNAAVAIIASRGLFGRRRNYLIVGLPLMHALPTEEFHAVLAHECAHLSDSQAADQVRMTQMQSVWQSVAANMSRGDAFGGFMFRAFFRWFLPRFVDRSLVYARELELDADHAGMLQTDTETSVRLEVRLAVVGLKLHDAYTEALGALLGESAEPSPGLTELKCRLAAEPVTSADQRYLSLALARTTGWRDSHPALRDRLAAYGVDMAAVTLPPVSEVSAATELLGSMAKELAERVDHELGPRIAGWWLHRHSVVANELEELRIIEHDARFGSVSDDERKRWAVLLARHRPARSAAALRELEGLVDVERERDAETLHCLGRLRLRQGDESGLEVLQRAAQLKPELTTRLQQEVGAFHAAQGRLDEAEDALRAEEPEESLVSAQVERFIVNDTIAIQPHRLEEHELVALRDALQRQQDVAEAWLVRKTLSQPSARPAYVLMVRDDLDGKAFFIGRARQKLVEGLNQRVSLEGDVMIVPLCEPLYVLWQRMRSFDTAQVYLKPGEQPYR